MPALRPTFRDRRTGVCMPIMSKIITPNKATLLPPVWPPVSANQPDAPCLNCRETDRQFHQARAAFTGQGHMREIIHRYKYDQHELLSRS